MNGPNPYVLNLSDTHRWVAYFRAREMRRPDALFNSPDAESLSGERGFRSPSLCLTETSVSGLDWFGRVIS